MLSTFWKIYYGKALSHKVSGKFARRESLSPNILSSHEVPCYYWFFLSQATGINFNGVLSYGSFLIFTFPPESARSSQGLPIVKNSPLTFSISRFN